MKRFTTIIENAREHFGEWLKPALAVGALFAIFFIAGGGVSQNDRWRIETIDIVGANTVPTDAIRALVKEKLAGNYFFVYARENSYLYPREEIERSLADTFPRIANVSVAQKDAHTISVTIAERKPYALWCGDESNANVHQLADCWFIDTTGFVFDRAPVFSEGVYMEVYGTLDKKNADEVLRGQLSPERFNTANTFAQMVHDQIGEPARIVLNEKREMELIVRSSVTFPFLSGATVKFKDEYVPAVLIKNLLAAIPVQFPAVANAIAGKPGNVASKKKLLYIDMRFGNKIFFGFEN